MNIKRLYANQSILKVAMSAAVVILLASGGSLYILVKGFGLNETGAPHELKQSSTLPSLLVSPAGINLAPLPKTTASKPATINTSSIAPTAKAASYRVNPICVSSHLNRLSNSDLNAQLRLMQQAGIKWTRFDFTMDVIEPSQGNFSWTSYDNIVNTTASYGINIIAVILQYHTPVWANNTSDNTVPPSPSIYQNFAEAIATHYSGKISLYEMGNEPNETSFWHPQWNAAAYTALLKAGYNGVKAGAPNAKVLSGGLSNASTTNSNYSAAVSFVQQMYTNGAKGYFDYFAFHPYQPNSPGFNVLSTIKTLMEQEGDKNKQIMITEVGWPTTSDFSHGGVTQANQATYISRVFTKIMHEDYQYVPIACIYDFINDGTNTTDNQENFGVLNADYTPKLSFTSMQNAALDFSSNFTAISP